MAKSTPSLFGVQNSNRDFSSRDSWSKNKFNSSFPASLIAYMDSKGLPCVYLTMDGKGNVVKKAITAKELFGKSPLDPDLYYSFESAYTPFQPITIGKPPTVDLMLLDTNSAKVISGYRPQARIIAITHLLHTLNRLELVWGVQTYSINAYKSTDDAMSQVEDLLLRYGLVKAGDRVVLTLGVPVVEKSKTNSLRVYTIGDRFVEKEPNDRLPLRCRD